MPRRRRNDEPAKRTLALLSVVLLAAVCATAAPAAPKLQVEVYQGGFASVNSFIFSNGQSLLVMDVQRTGR